MRTCTCFAMNSTFCLQVKWQLERLLGRYWVKLSTCRSAPLMSEWPRALERLYTFSAQRQEMTQISTTFPTNINIYTPHAHSLDSICFEKIVQLSSLAIHNVFPTQDSQGDLHRDQPPWTFNVGRVLSLE